MGSVPVFDDICADEWQQIPSLVAAQNGDGGGWLPSHEVLALLECWVLPAPPWSSASSADEAVAAAEAIGYPVVVKAISPTVLHKSDVGGVALDVRNAEELSEAYRRVRSRIPDSTAVLIQPLVRGCVEVLIGVKYDPAFGHLIGFGLGGVLVEALHDVRFRLHPLTDCDADDLIRESFAAHLLQPHRGRPAGDVGALREALLRVSALVTAMPEIDELDLNPVSVLPEGQGVRVLDARVHIGRVTPQARRSSA
jgi:acyl-CoA synthetase (NDP forming)